MMLRFFVFCFFFTLSLNLNSQNYCNNFYSKALELHIDKVKKINKDLDIIYIQKTNYFEVPDYIGDMKIVSLGRQSLMSMTKRGKVLPILVMNPIIFDGADLKIIISKNDVTRRRKKWNYASEYSTTVLVEYDCLKEEYVFKLKT